ncbi:MAG: tRNA uridine-5-carboxymethylaminomethyl(34) synthesis GTPase MnmE [Roseiflexaceae bacterium]|nr:tRNA uridine-5-carboxymethylaminomethyl(34) synthesis GTPase MnmE [Roseiflexaceae bacterium]
MMYDDTIAAIATPPGEGGIGIVRISGKDALPILERIFVPARPGPWKPYRMRYGHVVDRTGARVDEALAVFMRGPRSFTAEDTAEISVHGGPLVVEQVLQQALAAGARAANPGEFTMRAFLNGRIDLAQAEATLDIITARTTTALALAEAQLDGWLSRELRRIRDLLMDPLAYCTALVDFPEDEVEPQDIATPLTAAVQALEALVATAQQGIIYRQGARATLVGRPNAGKSSLLNALLRVDRAIVTPIPGTTRDTLEETANLGGVPVVLTDTAGIAESADPIERLGVERSRRAVTLADLLLLVVDGTAQPADDDREIVALTRGKRTVLTVNKIDLIGDADAVQECVTLLQCAYEEVRGTPFDATVAVSALTGQGLDALGATVARLLLGESSPADGRLVTNARHRDALARAARHARDALDGFQRGVSPDLLAVDLTAAINAIGEVTGETVGDDLLHAIFSRFCIGK